MGLWSRNWSEDYVVIFLCLQAPYGLYFPVDFIQWTTESEPSDSKRLLSLRNRHSQQMLLSQIDLLWTHPEAGPGSNQKATSTAYQKG